MDMLSTLTKQSPPPDLKHAWFQAPVLLEDAVGRNVTIPSEYDWEKLEVIIQVQFRRGPGSAKVKSGDYELFDTTNSGIRFLPHQGLIPGMRLTMAIVIGRYESHKRACPRMLCPGDLKYIQKSLMKCYQCGQFFYITQKELPQPVRPGDAAYRTLFCGLAKIEDERVYYKTLSICFMEWPKIQIHNLRQWGLAPTQTSLGSKAQNSANQPTTRNMLRRQGDALTKTSRDKYRLHPSLELAHEVSMNSFVVGSPKDRHYAFERYQNIEIQLNRSSAPGYTRPDNSFTTGYGDRGSLPLQVVYFTGPEASGSTDSFVRNEIEGQSAWVDKLITPISKIGDKTQDSVDCAIRSKGPVSEELDALSEAFHTEISQETEYLTKERRNMREQAFWVQKANEEWHSRRNVSIQPGSPARPIESYTRRDRSLSRERATSSESIYQSTNWW